MWDDLLAEQRKKDGDQFRVLKALPFRSITLGTPQPAEKFDHAIERINHAKPGRTLDHAAWVKLLDDLKSQHYKIVQSDWHHARFEANADGTATSTVTFAIHAVNTAQPQRFVVQGALGVLWSAKRDDRGLPVPESVDASEIQILSRSGEAAFEEILTVDPSQGGEAAGVQPLLVYDLNGDGRSEILLAGCNRRYSNQGDGKFEEEKFLWAHQRLFELARSPTSPATDSSISCRSITGGICSSTRATKTVNSGRNRSAVTSRRTVRSSSRKSSVSATSDRDGDLDLWIGQYKISYVAGQMPTPYYDANDGFPAFLLLNDGQGRFTDVTEESGLAKKRYRRTYGGSFIDLDDDGDLDLLVISDFSGVDVYHNDGRGRFTDVTDKTLSQRHIFGMSVTFGDYNLDEKLDFYVSGMASTTARRLEHMNLGRSDMADVHKMRPIMGYGSRMYLAAGERFEEPPFRDQVNRTGWTWGASSVDFDNDGDRDLYVANGHSSGKSTKDHCTHFWCHDIYTNNSKEDRARNELFRRVLKPYTDRSESWDGYQKKVLLMNLAGKGFVNIAFLLGLGFEYDARAVVGDDLDGDGRMDLLVVEDRWSDGQLLHVYRNRLETGNHWIGVRLTQEGPEGSPQGAKITVHTARGKQPGRIVTGDSIHCQHATTQHFGLGDLDRVEAIEVVWSDGKRSRVESPAVDQFHLVRRPKSQ